MDELKYTERQLQDKLSLARGKAWRDLTRRLTMAQRQQLANDLAHAFTITAFEVEDRYGHRPRRIEGGVSREAAIKFMDEEREAERAKRASGVWASGASEAAPQVSDEANGLNPCRRSHICDVCKRPTHLGRCADVGRTAWAPDGASVPEAKQPVAWEYRHAVNLASPPEQWTMSDWQLTYDVEKARKHPCGSMDWPRFECRPLVRPSDGKADQESEPA